MNDFVRNLKRVLIAVLVICVIVMAVIEVRKWEPESPGPAYRYLGVIKSVETHHLNHVDVKTKISTKSNDVWLNHSLPTFRGRPHCMWVNVHKRTVYIRRLDRSYEYTFERFGP